MVKLFACFTYFNLIITMFLVLVHIKNDSSLWNFEFNCIVRVLLVLLFQLYVCVCNMVLLRLNKLQGQRITRTFGTNYNNKNIIMRK